MLMSILRNSSRLSASSRPPEDVKIPRLASLHAPSSHVTSLNVTSRRPCWWNFNKIISLASLFCFSPTWPPKPLFSESQGIACKAHNIQNAWTVYDEFVWWIIFPQRRRLSNKWILDMVVQYLLVHQQSEAAEVVWWYNTFGLVWKWTCHLPPKYFSLKIAQTFFVFGYNKQSDIWYYKISF